MAEDTWPYQLQIIKKSGISNPTFFAYTYNMSYSGSYLQPGYNPAKHGWWKADTGEGNFGYPEGYYFADSLRACNVAFGAFFKDVYVIRFDELGYPRKRVKVPIKFGPRAKSHDQRVRAESEDNGQSYYIQNPSMAWKYTNISYDNTRCTSREGIRTFYDTYLMNNGVQYNTCDMLWKDTMPVPYNIGIELNAYCDKISDVAQIIEQICAKFNPESFVFIKEFWFMNIRRDIKLRFEGVNLDIQSDEMGSEQKREVKATFNFVLEAYFYKPIENGDLITSIVTTLDAHTNGYDLVRFGISGNAFKHSRYMNGETYMSASRAGYFDGSPTSGYDFTRNGRVTIGPAYRLVSTSSEAGPAKEIADGVSAYKIYYTYENIPDSYVEYHKYDTRVKERTMVKRALEDGGISDWEEYDVVYEPLATTTATNGYTYAEKDLVDNQMDAVRTIYATSHSQVTRFPNKG